jgi:tetratricopeptide (TPR) repeat protein
MEFKHEGNALFVEEAYAEAVAAYSRAVEALPRDADALSKRAAALLKLNKLREAAADADRAIAIDSRLPMAFMRKGCALAAFWDC